MPSWDFHLARMKSEGEDAKRILELLDGTLFPLHKKWRKLTHRLDRAPELALILSLYAEKATYFDILCDIVNHIEDDEVYNKLIYLKKLQHSQD